MGIRILKRDRTMTRLLTLIALITLFSGLSQQTSAQDPTLMVEGAKLWSDNCMRCHNARSPMERGDEDWKTIVTHMRVRANLTKSESDAILAYIQLANLPELAMPSHGDRPELIAPRKEVKTGESSDRPDHSDGRAGKD